jgi:hypothetical protein
MRKLVLFILIVSFLSAVFAAQCVDGQDILLKHVGGVGSHVCSPFEICPYNEEVCVSSGLSIQSVVGSCPVKSTKILGISSLLNAHAELPSQTNYGESICLGSTAAALCEYTSPGGNCVGEKVCLFSISSETNAHVSSCNTFLNEIKYCCEKSVIEPTDESGFVITDFTAKNIAINDNVDFEFTCNSLVSEKLKLTIFDSTNTRVGDVFEVDCSVDKEKFTNFQFTEDYLLGNYFALLKKDGCVSSGCERKAFFKVSLTRDSGISIASIPDNNLILVFFVAICVIGLVIFERKNDKKLM